jgi:hypothetical protein
VVIASSPTLAKSSCPFQQEPVFETQDSLDLSRNYQLEITQSNIVKQFEILEEFAEEGRECFRR